MRKLTQDQFLRRSKSIHGDTYDYSMVEYIRSTDKVNIICKVHGEFKQEPKAHLIERGCRECANEMLRLNRRESQDDVIKNFRSIHGDIYDYSLVIYKNTDTKVDIICQHHGVFKQSPYLHSKGQGCPLCANNKIGLKHRYNTDSFIKKANKKHDNRYGYSLVKYIDSKTKVKIECYKHGVFEQVPSSHLSGDGCFMCGFESSIEYQKENPTGWSITQWQLSGNRSKYFDSFKVYIIKCWNDEESFYKVGRTFKKTKIRFSGEKSMPYNYEIVKEFIFDTAKEAYDYENKLKIENKDHKYIPNIKFHGVYECFSKLPIIL